MNKFKKIYREVRFLFDFNIFSSLGLSITLEFYVIHVCLSKGLIALLRYISQNRSSITKKKNKYNFL